MDCRAFTSNGKDVDWFWQQQYEINIVSSKAIAHSLILFHTNTWYAKWNSMNAKYLFVAVSFKVFVILMNL